MPEVNASPGRVKVGKDVRITGSGFPSGQVKITVNYEHRAESYKALVAGKDDDAHSPGDIDYTVEAYEPGVAPVQVWDGRQREVLAETFFRVTDG